MEIMKFTITDGYKVSFTADFSREAWMPFLTKASAQLQKKRPIKGFRAGAAPVALAEREFGDDLYKPAAKDAVDACIEKVCLEKQLLPVSLPQVEIFKPSAEGFSCAVTFERYPEVTAMEYKGIQAEKPVCKCTEADIDAEIAQFMRQHLDVREVAREARMGDIAEVDFTGTHNGGSFPYDHSSKSRFLLGSGQLFAGLDEALCGHVAGDHLDITLTMPQDFHRPDVAGLTLDLSVNLHGVWAREMRELNDDFVKECVNGAETVEEYREQTRQKLQKRFDERSQKLFYANINKALAQALPVEIPPAMIETTAKRYMNTLNAFAKQEGLTMEQYLAREGKTLEDYKKMVQPAAREQTAVSIAVDYVISAENLQVTQERLQRYYVRYAEANKLPVEEAKRYVNEGALIDEYLQKDAMNLIRASAVPVIVEVDRLPNELSGD